MIISSMNKINSNNWAPRNQLSIPIPITDPPVGLQGLCFFAYNPERLVWFYYRLGSMLYNILDKDSYFSVLYNILYEDNYFDEED